MCRLETCPADPTVSEESITLDVVDGVEGALEEVLEEVMTEQVKQRLWECVVAALRHGVQWMVDRVQSWRQRDV